MKKISAVLSVMLVFALFMPITANAEAKKSEQYNIQFEKLAGTEDAEEFNACKSEILAYFNSLLKEKKLTPLKSYELDFNEESLVQGFKFHGDYTEYAENATYDEILKSVPDYDWRISVRTEKTAVYAIISHCSEKDSRHFHFGNDWCMTWCTVSKSQGKTGTSNISAVNAYALYDGAEKNLNKFIKADPNDDIKILYVKIGNSEEDFFNYISGGIVFINDKAEYIYSFGFNIRGDMVAEDTPEEIKILLEKCSSEMYNNYVNSVYGSQDVKGLYDYEQIMDIIKMYETYFFMPFTPVKK